LVRRFVISLAIITLAPLAVAFLVEFWLEMRDTALYTPGQTFATVGNARVRYRLLSPDRPGATVVILSGVSGSIEQADQLQLALSSGPSAVPSLAYDRAGYGFSVGSSAHSAEEQADELAGLLKSLHIEAPVVLVGYSFSGPIARVFAGRFPEKTAALYLIEPASPELNQRQPHLHSPQRTFARTIAHQLISSSLGYIRLNQRLRDWQGPSSLVERRAEAILARRTHYWAQALEWYALPQTWQQALNSQVPALMPLEIVISNQTADDEVTKSALRTYRDVLAELAARSSHGHFLELEGVKHSDFLKAGPALDRLVERIESLSHANLQK
jgi:pimeloyl-ACP methyl ester carboxylesterase